MKPSNAATISSRFSIACGFSIFAITGSITPSSRMIRRTSSASAALRTKLSATKSTVRCSANRRSSMSFSDSAGTETATPGRLMPLLLLTLPPTSTSVCTSVPSTSVTRSRTLPSSIRIGSPASTSPARPSYVVPQISSLPSTSSRVVIVHRCPRRSVTGPSANVSSRIFGPCRSARIATPCPLESEASRTSLYAAAWSSWVPWLMFSRATSIPAYTSSRIRRSEELAGPRVHTIFALRTPIERSADVGTIQQSDVRCPAARRLVTTSDDQRALGRLDGVRAVSFLR